MAILSAVLLATMPFGAWSSSKPFTANESAIDELILVYRDTNGNTDRFLAEESVEISEIYDSFVLARVNEAQRHKMDTIGIGIREMPDRTEISLGAYSFDTRDGEPELPSDLRINGYPRESDGYYILQFIGPTKRNWVNEIETMGATFYGFIPNYAHIVRMKEDSLREVEAYRYTQWVGIYQPAYKLAPALHNVAGEVELYVEFFRETDLPPTLGQIVQGNKAVNPYCNSERLCTMLRTHVASIPTIAHTPEVRWIRPNAEHEYLANNIIQWEIQSGIEDYRPIWDHGIQGEGQIIGIADSGVYVEHNAFRDDLQSVHYTYIGSPSNPNLDHRKIIQYWIHQTVGDDQDSSFWFWHGTHTGSMSAGNDVPSGGPGTYNGMAPEARLTVSDYCVGLACAPTFPTRVFYDDGARIGSLSAASSGLHLDDDAHGLDSDPYEIFGGEELLWELSDFLFVHSAGNSGPSPGSVGNPGRQEVTVGASYKGTEKLEHYSARGPTSDGRLKPTLLAPTYGVAAAGWSPTYYTPMGGTSGSSPIAAGAATLVRQYFMDGWYPTGAKVMSNGFEPSAALLKAMLINSAEEMDIAREYDGTLWSSHANPYDGMEYPNSDQGWGKIDLENCMFFEGENRRLWVVDDEAGLSTGQYVDYYVWVSDSSEPLEATLVWTDYPTTPGSAKTLVNDLDLSIYSPDNEEYRGTKFAYDAALDRWHSEPSPTSWDDVNSVENVLKLNPEVGLWKIRVSGTNVHPTRPSFQPFALVVTGALSDEMKQSEFPYPSSDPAVTVDSQGNAHMVWVEDVDGDNEIFYKKIDANGNTLIETQSLTDFNSNLDGDNQYGPIIAISSVTDAVFVLFANEDEISDREYYIDGKRSDDGGQIWVDLTIRDQQGDPLLLFQTTDLENSRDVVDTWRPMDLDIDSLGTIHVLYTFMKTGFETTNGASEAEYVLYARSLDPYGDQWTSLGTSDALYAETYLDPGFDHLPKIRSPNIAIGSSPLGLDSYIHTIYSYDTELDPLGGPYCGMSFIRYLRSIDRGLTWDRSIVDIGHPYTYIGSIAPISSLDADFSGGIYVVWQEWTAEESIILFTRNINHGESNWENQRVLFDGVGEGRFRVYPDIKLGSDYLYLVWADSGIGSEVNYEIYYSVTLDKGINWHGPKRITFFRESSITPFLAIHYPFQSPTYNSIHVVWADQRDGHFEIYHQTLTKDKRIDHTSLNSETPWIETDSAGNQHIVWTDDRSGKGSRVTYTWRGWQWTELDSPWDAECRYPYVFVTEPDRVIKLDDSGTILWEYSGLNGAVDADFIPSVGPPTHALITERQGGRVIEVEISSGNIVWERSGLNKPWDAERKGSNTLITEKNRVIEVDVSGNIIWEYTGLTDAVDAEYMAEEPSTGRSWILIVEKHRVIHIEYTPRVQVWELGGFDLLMDGESYVPMVDPWRWLPTTKVRLTDYANNRIIDVDQFGFIKNEIAGLCRPVDAKYASNGDLITERNCGNGIYYTKLDQDGSPLSSILKLTEGILDNRYGPIISVSPVDDTLFVFYANEVELPNRRYVIEGKKSIDGGETWEDLTMEDGLGEPFVLFRTTDPDNSRDVIDTWRPMSVEIDENGIIHVLYTYYDTTGGGIEFDVEHLRYVRSLDSSGNLWEDSQVLRNEWYFPGFYPHTRKIRSPNLVRAVIGPTEKYLHATYSFDEAVDQLGLPPVGPSYIIPLRSEDNGNTWQQFVPYIAVTDEVARESTLTADNAGNVYVAWQDKTVPMPGHVIWFARSPISGLFWDLPVALPQGSFDDIHPFMKLDATGYIHLIWSGEISPDVRCLYHIASIDGGTSWIGLQSLLTHSIGSSKAPVFSIDQADRLNIVWQSDGGNSEKWKEVYYQYWL